MLLRTTCKLVLGSCALSSAMCFACFVVGARASNLEPIESDVFYRGVLKGMVPIPQPQDYSNQMIRLSPDKSRDAFMCYDGTNGDRIIVMDRQTQAESILAPPKEEVYEARQIRDLTWDENGQMIYVIEDGTAGVRGKAAFAALDPQQLEAQEVRDYFVVSRCKPGDAEAQIVDKFPWTAGNGVLTATSGAGSVWVVNHSQDKGWGFIDVREYRDGKRISLRTFPLTFKGKPIECHEVQYLPKRNELWFLTLLKGPHSARQWWLAVMNLGKSGSEVQMIASDVTGLVCSADEARIVVYKCSWKYADWSSGVINLLLLRPDAPDHPTTLASQEFSDGDMGPDFAGFSGDGQVLYLKGLAKPIMTADQLRTPGAWKLFELTLPN
jgi:hypothetical protein